LIFSLILLVVSMFPVLGLRNWWLIVGLRTQLFAVLTVVSVLMVISGILWHLFLIRNLKIED
jgi:hypothetical protein